VAVKILLKQDFDDKTLRAFRHEVEVMSKIFHPNINLFMGACTLPGNLMIVTELMRGDLETMLLDENIHLNLLQRMKMIKDAALGILWLHCSNPQIIHRDLKPSNLLVDDNLTCKICDFGLSQLKARGKNLIDGKEGAKGTPLWMAPEVMMGEEFNEKADVYSFGLVLWFCLTGKEPYEEFDDLEKFTHAICIQHVRPSIPINDATDSSLASLADLIVRCWHPNPVNRPSFSDIVARLDHIIVDCAIDDPIGRKFWKDTFLRKESLPRDIFSVPWNEFINAFCNLLSLLPDNFHQMQLSEILSTCPELLKNSTIEIDIKCFKALVAEKSKKHLDQDSQELVVPIEKFGNLLKWFALNLRPVDGMTILNQIRQLMTEAWFHGDISTPESENRLMNKPEGSFLVRFSNTTAGCFSISKVSMDGSIKHHKILHKAGEPFEINSKSYSSLQELVLKEKSNLHLYSPCPGSRFLSLFYEQRISGYVN